MPGNFHVDKKKTRFYENFYFHKNFTTSSKTTWELKFRNILFVYYFLFLKIICEESLKSIFVSFYQHNFYNYLFIILFEENRYLKFSLMCKKKNSIDLSFINYENKSLEYLIYIRAQV